MDAHAKRISANLITVFALHQIYSVIRSVANANHAAIANEYSQINFL